MKEYTANVLKRAKHRRDHDLSRLRALYRVCVCAYPIKRIRTLSGHDDDCPAHVLFLRFKTEDAEARAKAET